MTALTLFPRRWCVVLFCLSGLLPWAQAQAYGHREPIRHRAAFATTGSVVIVNVNGDISVRTWDKNEILIEGEKSAQTAEELRAIDLVMNVSPERAEIRVTLPKRNSGWFRRGTIRAKVELTVYVPRTATLESVETVNSTVSLEGVQGAVRAETVNGRIQADGLGGSAELSTVNGQIVARFGRVTAGQKLAFETVNGSVEIHLPEDAGVALDAQVVNGRVECEFPLTLTKSKGKRSLAGTIGDGRAALEAATVNGQVRVRRG